MRLISTLLIVLMMTRVFVPYAYSQESDPCELVTKKVLEAAWKSVKEFSDFKCPEGFVRKDDASCPSITPWCEEVALIGLKYIEQNNIFGETLRGLTKDKTKHIYQLGWLTELDGNIFVRLDISQENKSKIFVKKIVSGKAGNLGTIQMYLEGEIDRNKIKRFLDKVNKNDFWKSLKTRERRAVDGATWIIEGIKDGNYHLVERWSPDDHDKIKAIFINLFEMGADFVQDKTQGEKKLIDKDLY